MIYYLSKEGVGSSLAGKRNRQFEVYGHEKTFVNLFTGSEIKSKQPL